ncbi:MAG: MerR family transcriptional regulator [Bacteroidales bacterium]
MNCYSIKDLEKLSGIKAHTIRMWEKRFNIITPERTKTNIRCYNDDDLKKLLNISTLYNHGLRISKIAAMDRREINEKVAEMTQDGGSHEDHINNLTVSMIDMNEATFEQILNNAILRLGFEKTVTEILYPFLDKVGVLWLAGTIHPAQEHFVSNLIRQKLIIAIDSQVHTKNDASKTFLLYLPEQELHELGLLFYNYLLRKGGYEVIYLGQSVPFNDLKEVANIKQVDYLFTYFVAALSTKEIPVYLDRISAAFPDKIIYITGIQAHKYQSSLPANIVLIANVKHFKELLQIG